MYMENIQEKQLCLVDNPYKKRSIIFSLYRTQWVMPTKVVLDMDVLLEKVYFIQAAAWLYIMLTIWTVKIN